MSDSFFQIDGNLALQPNNHSSLISNGQIEKDTYRTQQKAGVVVKMPHKYAIITDDQYKNAMGLYQDGKAYLQPLSPNANLEYKNGMLFFEGLPASEELLKKSFEHNLSGSMDLPLLRVFYSILLNNYQNGNASVIATIYLPDLFSFLGKKTVSRNEIEGIISSMIQFHNTMGIIDGNILPVLLYMGEDREKNTISFASPYMSRVIEKIHKVSILTDKKGIAKHGKDGVPNTKPVYSFLIKPTIRNERNKRAVEIVHIVTLLIEQAGNHTPHISAKTIIERNPLLNYSLKNAKAADKNKALKRAFSKAWELLHTQTYLEDTYKDICLPDPNNPIYIPTMSSIDMIFEFPHKGKS